MSLRAQLLIIATILGVPALYWTISTGMLTLVERSRLNSPDGQVEARVVSRGDWQARTHVYLEIREPGSVTYVPLETLSGPDEIRAESYALNWLDQKTVRVLGRAGDFTRYWDIEIGPEKIYFELRTTPPDPIPKASPDSQPGKNAKTAARNGLSPSRGQALAWGCSGSLPECLIL